MGSDGPRSVKLRLRPYGGFEQLVVDVPLVSYGPAMEAPVYRVARSDPSRMGTIILETTVPPAWGDDRYLWVELRELKRRAARTPKRQATVARALLDAFQRATYVFGELVEKVGPTYRYRCEVEQGEYRVDTRQRGAGQVNVVPSNTVVARLSLSEDKSFILRLKAQDSSGRELRECQVIVWTGDLRGIREFRRHHAAYQRSFPYGLSTMEVGPTLNRGSPFTIRIPAERASIDGRSPAVTVVVTKPGFKPFTKIVALRAGEPAIIVATLDEK